MSRKDTLSTDHLRTYFLSMGSALSRDGLNTELELGTRAMRDWLSGKRDLPENALPKVLAWARRYGYQEQTQYDQFL